MVTDHVYEKEEIRDRNGNNLSFRQHVAEWIGFDLGLGLGLDFFFRDKSEEKAFTLIKELTPGSNIFDVIKTGSLDAVRYLVEHYGQRVLYERDGDGHTTVHWVCRLGFSDILAFMLDLGMPLDIPSLSDPEPRPVHWACLSGDVAVMEILIQSGVSVNSTDTRGRTPLIVATQKGNTHLVGYLLAKGSDHKLRDNNGDSALHWAAYKGYPDITQLLVHSGSDTEVKDNYGHTPLHLACIGGSVNTVKELTNKCHGNLTVEDEKGRTPLELAINHRNWDVVSYLRTCHKRSFILNAWHFVFGSSTNSRVPLVIFLLVPLCYGYPLYILRCIPLTWRELHSIHVVFLVFNVIVWVSMLIAHSLDPGYLPQNTVEYETAVEQMADFGKWRESKSPMTRLCHTCRCVRPLRAKHCRVCNRCIQHFDHHCPFIYNCVGLKNRGWFLIFVTSVVIACAMVIYLALATVHADSWRLEYQFGVAIAVLAAAIAGIMTVSVLINALLNLTSNECLNFRRYGYLRDGNGKFNNPFNRGIVRNLEEFFRSVRVWDINDIEPQQGLLV